MQRYFAKEKREQEFFLQEEDYHHIRTVMRMNSGDQIEVVYDGCVYLCCIEYVNKEIVIKVLKQCLQEDAKFPKIVLILPFLKEQKMDIILQKGTELGVDEFVFSSTERSIVKVEPNKESSKIERWSRICKEASEQSMRTTIPIVRIERNRENLENLEGLKLLCSTIEKEKTIKKLLKNHDMYDTINLMIGPEGGFSEEEEQYFEKKGFMRVSLGTQIMRVETVPIFLSSIIRYEFME